MSEADYIKRLEERIDALEHTLSHIKIGEGKSISFHNCSFAEVHTADGCDLSFHSCPIGGVISDDIDEAEDRVDELESRLQDIIDSIEEIENK